MKLILCKPIKALCDIGLNRKRRAAKLAEELLIIASGALQGVFNRNREGPGFLPAAQILKAMNAGHSKMFVAVPSELSSLLNETGTATRDVSVPTDRTVLEERCTLHSARYSAPGTRHLAP